MDNNNIQQQLHQQQKSNKKYFAVIIMLLLVIGLSVGYAALTASLNITGSTKINGDTSWDVSPDEDIEEAVECPAGEVCTILDDKDEAEATDPDDGTGSNPTGAVIWMDAGVFKFKHLLTAPGESFSFNVTYENNGSLDAKIDDFSIPTYEGTPAEGILTATLTLNGSAVTKDTVLAAGSSHTFTVTVSYADLNSLPSAATINAINAANSGKGVTGEFVVQYVQA